MIAKPLTPAMLTESTLLLKSASVLQAKATIETLESARVSLAGAVGHATCGDVRKNSKSKMWERPHQEFGGGCDLLADCELPDCDLPDRAFDWFAEEEAQESVKSDSETRQFLDRLWQIVVWDDPINLMSYVTYILQRLFGYSSERATQMMLEIHNSGRSIVAVVERERAELIVGRLHSYGLQATLEKAL